MRSIFATVPRDDSFLPDADEIQESAAARFLTTDAGFRAAFDGTQIGITITDPGGRIVYVNPALALMHGYEPDDLLGQLSHVLGAKSARQTITPESLSARKRWRRETLNRRKDGSTFPVHLMSDVLETEAGVTIGMVTLCEDITERKRTEEAQVRSALRDPVTRLASRTFFLQLVDRVVKRRERHPDHQFAILYVDLDRFTLINDSFGHEGGDAILCAVSERLSACIRPSDVLARIAGDEFAALLDGIRDTSDGTRVAERFVDAMRNPFAIDDSEIYLTASIGIAVTEASVQSAEQYLADASSAMHRARVHGEGRYEVFDRAVHRRATGRLRLETDLRRAIDHDELHVLYQPLISLRDDTVAGFEALVRWRHDQRGMISPGEFIPVAEETGLIMPIGSWVLQAACGQLADWLQRFPEQHSLTVNVNFSARHLRQPDVLEQVLATLDRTGLPRSNLKLEITETMLMEDAEGQLAVLDALRKAGIGVAIDDFGTGYSSLSYLRRFAIDSLKIDRSFLTGADTDEAWEIVRMIIGLARGMGVTVVAEGVETEEQRRRLRDLGCDRAQGFLFAKPLEADAAAKLLEGVSPTA